MGGGGVPLLLSSVSCATRPRPILRGITLTSGAPPGSPQGRSRLHALKTHRNLFPHFRVQEPARRSNDGFLPQDITDELATLPDLPLLHDRKRLGPVPGVRGALRLGVEHRTRTSAREDRSSRGHGGVRHPILDLDHSSEAALGLLRRPCKIASREERRGQKRPHRQRTRSLPNGHGSIPYDSGSAPPSVRLAGEHESWMEGAPTWQACSQN